MDQVDIAYRGKGLDYIEIKGHANTAPAGHDLVCAAVSAIAIGSLNALDEENDYEFIVEDGHVKVSFPTSISEHDQIVFETMIMQLKTIEVSYKEAISIKERK